MTKAAAKLTDASITGGEDRLQLINAATVELSNAGILAASEGSMGTVILSLLSGMLLAGTPLSGTVTTLYGQNADRSTKDMSLWQRAENYAYGNIEGNYTESYVNSSSSYNPNTRMSVSYTHLTLPTKRIV